MSPQHGRVPTPPAPFAAAAQAAPPGLSCPPLPGQAQKHEQFLLPAIASCERSVAPRRGRGSAQSRLSRAPDIISHRSLQTGPPQDTGCITLGPRSTPGL